MMIKGDNELKDEWLAGWLDIGWLDIVAENVVTLMRFASQRWETDLSDDRKLLCDGDLPWKEKHYARSINVPKTECNFREEKNRVSLVTTNQLLCAILNKNVTDVMPFPFPEVKILVNTDSKWLLGLNYS